MLMHICLHLDDDGRVEQSSKLCGSKLFWILGYYTSL